MSPSFDERIKGCLLGGAVGDALGYAVEFLPEEQIFEKYGFQGITEFDTNGTPTACVSDDTQMSLFTAAGLLLAKQRQIPLKCTEKYVTCIAEAYADWFTTQIERYPPKAPPATPLGNESGMYHRRAPGGTCLAETGELKKGKPPSTMEAPSNFSKGCGGVMRVAPIGFGIDNTEISLAEIDLLAAKATALTHGHPLAYIPSAALVHIIHSIIYDNLTPADAVQSALMAMPMIFSKSQHMDDFILLMQKAVALSTYDLDDLDAIHELGTGYCGHDNLAIAVYCSLKYSNDYEAAMIAAVNHGGDSDSTGSVTGNIMGAYLGCSAIPGKYLEKLELKQVILEIAEHFL